jgi:hypothetical protein
LDSRAANQYFQFFLAGNGHDFCAPAEKGVTLSHRNRVDKVVWSPMRAELQPLAQRQATEEVWQIPETFQPLRRPTDWWIAEWHASCLEGLKPFE